MAGASSRGCTSGPRSSGPTILRTYRPGISRRSKPAPQFRSADDFNAFDEFITKGEIGFARFVRGHAGDTKEMSLIDPQDMNVEGNGSARIRLSGCSIVTAPAAIDLCITDAFGSWAIRTVQFLGDICVGIASVFGNSERKYIGGWHAVQNAENPVAFGHDDPFVGHLESHSRLARGRKAKFPGVRGAHSRDRQTQERKDEQKVSHVHSHGERRIDRGQTGLGRKKSPGILRGFLEAEEYELGNLNQPATAKK